MARAVILTHHQRNSITKLTLLCAKFLPEIVASPSKGLLRQIIGSVVLLEEGQMSMPWDCHQLTVFLKYLFWDKKKLQHMLKLFDFLINQSILYTQRDYKRRDERIIV